MKVVKRKIEDDGRIYIPKQIIENLGIKKGQELELFLENDAIVIRVEKTRRSFAFRRKKLKISPHILDQLVEEEELFEAEWT